MQGGVFSSMDLLNIVLDNALLTSVIIFPLGNIMLFGMVKLMLFPKTNPGQIMKDLLAEYRKHVQAEVLLTDRLNSIDTHVSNVSMGFPDNTAAITRLTDKVDTVNSNIWDVRRELDGEFEDWKEFRVLAQQEMTRMLHYLELLQTLCDTANKEGNPA